jgi:hypothetical protein
MMLKFSDVDIIVIWYSDLVLMFGFYYDVLKILLLKLVYTVRTSYIGR